MDHLPRSHSQNSCVTSLGLRSELLDYTGYVLPVQVPKFVLLLDAILEKRAC